MRLMTDKDTKMHLPREDWLEGIIKILCSAVAQACREEHSEKKLEPLEKFIRVWYLCNGNKQWAPCSLW